MTSIPAFALSAASLFLTAACGGSAAQGTANHPGPSAAPTSAGEGGGDDGAMAQVKCMGVNECKGQSACNVAGSHACAGQNACKGKGWIMLGGSDCAAKGGTVLE